MNKTSYLENAETSAIGRALGTLGIGIEDSFASANEVKTATENQNNPDLDKPWLTEKQYATIVNYIREGVWPNKQFPDHANANEAFEYLQSKYRMKKTYREGIREEIESPFNKALSEEPKKN